MANIESQTEEVLALQSIYEADDFFVENEETPVRGRFIAEVNLPSGFQVFYSNGNERKCFPVEYLPPINLFFEYPETYPSETCAAFLLSCSWLTLNQISTLCQELESIWQRSGGEVILFQWINFLQEECLTFLDIENELDITKLSRYKYDPTYFSGKLRRKITCAAKIDVQNCNASCSKTEDISENGTKHMKKLKQNSERVRLNLKPSISRGHNIFDQRAVLDLTDDLVSVLQQYNKYRKREKFLSESHTCRICFITKRGKEFMLFSNCDHMYCRECLTSYFEIQIKDGNVNALNCPEEKCLSEADGALVKELVSPELFYKYDQLLLARTLDCMSDVAYCPRQFCQCAVLIESGSTMGCCPACKFIFCILCRMAYHGIAPCNLRNEERQRICREYLNSKGETRIELEKRYGKRVLKLLVENSLSEEWKDTFSKKCPRCETNIEKFEGCNKMTCFRCGSYFCWLCMTKLNAVNPYKHFDDPTSPCFQQLFPDTEDFDDEFIEPGEFLN